MASIRAKVADPQTRGRRGQTLSEEGVKGVAVGYIRRKLSIAAEKAQSHSLLGRLEDLGPGASAAAGRRRRAMEQERLWARERQAYGLSVKQELISIGEGLRRLTEQLNQPGEILMMKDVIGNIPTYPGSRKD